MDQGYESNIWKNSLPYFHFRVKRCSQKNIPYFVFWGSVWWCFKIKKFSIKFKKCTGGGGSYQFLDQIYRKYKGRGGDKAKKAIKNFCNCNINVIWKRTRLLCLALCSIDFIYSRLILVTFFFLNKLNLYSFSFYFILVYHFLPRIGRSWMPECHWQ